MSTTERLDTATIRQVYNPGKFIIDGGSDRVGPKVLDTVAALCDEVDRLRTELEEAQLRRDARRPACECGWIGTGNHYHDARMGSRAGQEPTVTE